MSPVPLEELRKRRDNEPRQGTHGDRVLAFLRKHENDGWRAVELSETLDIEQYTLGSVLRRLRKRGLVDVIKEHWFAMSDHDVAVFQSMVYGTRLANEEWGPEDPKDWPSIPQQDAESE